MPASVEMESSFCKERRFQTAEVSRGRFGKRPSLLMHPGGYAVTAIGLDRCRATAQSAEQNDGRDERK
jgi:hypothetical protein